MRIKGKIICNDGKYIVARMKADRINEKVYSSSGRYIGRVVKIFGPVSEPYVKIRIERKWGRKVGEIYIRGDKNGRKRKEKVDRRNHEMS